MGFHFRRSGSSERQVLEEVGPRGQREVVARGRPDFDVATHYVHDADVARHGDEILVADATDAEFGRLGEVLDHVGEH
eukprot:14533097-Alexandrium_andersonii.AAC.1